MDERRMWKVAIVDDEPTTREGLLRHVPWQALNIGEVKAAADAVQMLALCEAMRPDIVISDVRMPGMDGIALCRELRALYPHCRIIFLSGYSDKAYLLSAIEISAVSYVEKPVDVEALTRVLRRAVSECEELNRSDYSAIDAALFAQFVSAVATGGRAEAFKVADQVYQTLKEEKATSLQAARRLYFQLGSQLTQQGLQEALAACADLEALHAVLLSRIEAALPVGQEGAALSGAVRKVIRFMEAELGNEELTIDMMARHVYLSPTYLANVFKKETGRTIGQYLLELRMQRAKELLGDGMLRLYQIARRVGYTDPNYFAKTFRRVVGVSPREYRERMP